MPPRFTYTKPLFRTWTPPSKTDEARHNITIVQVSDAESEGEEASTVDTSEPTGSFLPASIDNSEEVQGTDKACYEDDIQKLFFPPTFKPLKKDKQKDKPNAKSGKGKRLSNPYSKSALYGSNTTSRRYEYINGNVRHYTPRRKLVKWENESLILHDDRNGFRKGRSTIDHIKSLIFIIENRKLKRLSTSVASIDFRKAYDGINRAMFFQKVFDLGVCGNINNAILSLYKSVECCVRINGYQTD
ncbi:Hypothetical predicted protein [Mytilus galloprovincialis]|uniref:Reverse transcriptase domain-containing protein n=1 Tax=Mytilus galloprovincialis TaxID=29158 RepID=A0A8B6H3A0_MYTGA|nr:Hypothetical predicted protein [Mytilus galloprovincialis]